MHNRIGVLVFSSIEGKKKKMKEKLAHFSMVTNEMTMMDLAQDVTNIQMTNTCIYDTCYKN